MRTVEGSLREWWEGKKEKRVDNREVEDKLKEVERKYQAKKQKR